MNMHIRFHPVFRLIFQVCNRKKIKFAKYIFGSFSIKKYVLAQHKTCNEIHNIPNIKHDEDYYKKIITSNKSFLFRNLSINHREIVD